MPFGRKFERAFRRIVEIYAAGGGARPRSLFGAEPIESAASRPRWSMRGPLALFLLLVVAIGIVGSFYIEQQYVDAHQTVDREVSTIADMKAAQIANWWRERRSDAEVIFRQP